MKINGKSWNFKISQCFLGNLGSMKSTPQSYVQAYPVLRHGAAECSRLVQMTLADALRATSKHCRGQGFLNVAEPGESTRAGEKHFMHLNRSPKHKEPIQHSSVAGPRGVAGTCEASTGADEHLARRGRPGGGDFAQKDIKNCIQVHETAGAA